MTGGAEELIGFARHLGELANELTPKVDGIMTRGAVKIKQQMNADLAASWSFHGIAGTVDYDKKSGADGVDFEIGPNKDRNGGALANIAYFGGANGGGGTVDLEGPWRSEAETITDLIGKLVASEANRL